MNLVIDWGNTRVKAAFFEGEKLQHDYNFSEDEALSQLINLVDEYKPTHTILCTVANNPPELKMLLQEKSQLLILNSNTPLPILNAYHSPDSLGMDRIALAVGINAIEPDKNNVVVSIGTAVTYNFVHKNRIFRGGNITPGLQMRFKALHEYTDRLPLVSEQGELVLLGYDTDTSIRSGVIMGMVAEIDGMLNYYAEQYSDFNAVLTGGNAPLFVGKLKKQIFADSQLLLKGLNTILRHNAR